MSGFRIETRLARILCAPVLGIAIAAVAACGGSSGNSATTATSQATPTTVATPTLVQGAAQGAAVNASYWKTQLAGLDAKTREFADHYAAGFCKNPQVAHLDARMVSAGQGLGRLKYEYAFWSHKGEPTWGNDAATQSKIAYYMVSNYCPENPS